MPYNTRRVSLSLSELGIQVPKRHRAPSQSMPSSGDTEERPIKKAKRESAPSSPKNMDPPSSTNIRTKQEPARPASMVIEHTPPPSPGAQDVSKVDTDGIKDDIVVGVILQLEKTGNRPHTSKELAAVLANSVATIESSTNPNALIQARLAAYLKGPWPLVSPCPLGKQQENIHPRRVFYHLTTSAHQPIPDVSHSQPATRRIISPSLSSADDIEDKYNRERTRLSPSPEVDLSSPELEDETDVERGSSFSSRHSLPRDHPPTSSNLAHNRRADSPELEREEKDFKQTANELQQQRRDSQQHSEGAASADGNVDGSDDAVSVEMVVESAEETEEAVAQRNKEAAAQLFGDSGHLSALARTYDLSSPVMKPQVEIPNKSVNELVSMPSLPEPMVLAPKKVEDDKMDLWGAWDESGELQSPENVELDELEGLFDAY